jgi:hypothetical protein
VNIAADAESCQVLQPVKVFQRALHTGDSTHMWHMCVQQQAAQHHTVRLCLDQISDGSMQSGASTVHWLVL